MLQHDQPTRFNQAELGNTARTLSWVQDLNSVTLMPNPEDLNPPLQGSERGSSLPSSSLPGMDCEEFNMYEEMKCLKQALAKRDQEMAMMMREREDERAMMLREREEERALMAQEIARLREEAGRKVAAESEKKTKAVALSEKRRRQI